MMVISPEIREWLELKAAYYNRPEFIESDPISIPHRFSLKEDIEIAGFLTAMISWGQRKTIINNAYKLIQMMGLAPYDYIIHAGDREIGALSGFKHRTFNGEDCIFFMHSLKNIYHKYGGLEKAFNLSESTDVYTRIIHFRRAFFGMESLPRTGKHIADPSRGASAKRINMFLRWMVRKDGHGVDFGIWDSIPMKDLMCPLDTHSGTVARKLGLLHRKQNDWKAVEELTDKLRLLDPHDPVRYDFALFGMGVFEKF
jgi:uncharacterized protein (TIGR02757 family)